MQRSHSDEGRGSRKRSPMKSSVASERPIADGLLGRSTIGNDHELERALVRKIDMRLCTIAGLLCSLSLLDSSIISSAAVTSMPIDLGLIGNRFSVAIFIFYLTTISFNLPATILMRFLGPPLYFSCTTVAFGLITLSTAYIKTWRQMIVLRVLLGLATAGIFPGLSYLVSTYYTRKEQQLRFAFLQCCNVIILATGSIVNYALNRLDHSRGLRGWQWMYIVQGTVTMALGIATFFWIPEFPENSARTFMFLKDEEIERELARIDSDRGDAGNPEPFRLRTIAAYFLDPKLYAFSVLFFLLNIVSTALSYFLPIILTGMGFSDNQAIILSGPPYYYAVIPALLSSRIGDKYRLRGPVIIFNAACLVAGFYMLGFAKNVVVRYIGTFLATGAYVSNWAALNAYQANNIRGQWKRATIAAAVSACNGAGGVAGSFIVRREEASFGYPTAIWVSIGSHILMIVIVLLITMIFWVANRHARIHGRLIEGIAGFRYTY